MVKEWIIRSHNALSLDLTEFVTKTCLNVLLCHQYFAALCRKVVNSCHAPMLSYRLWVRSSQDCVSVGLGAALMSSTELTSQCCLLYPLKSRPSRMLSSTNTRNSRYIVPRVGRNSPLMHFALCLPYSCFLNLV